MPKVTAENADVRRDRVRRWKQSGLTAKAFAELEGLPRPAALSWWQYQLRLRDKKAKSTDDGSLRLIRLEGAELVPHGGRGRSEGGVVAPIEVTFGAYRIVVRAGFDVTMLEGVLRALERAR